jgi:hypothetical protein
MNNELTADPVLTNSFANGVAGPSASPDAHGAGGLAGALESVLCPHRCRTLSYPLTFFYRALLAGTSAPSDSTALSAFANEDDIRRAIAAVVNQDGSSFNFNTSFGAYGQTSNKPPRARSSPPGPAPSPAVAAKRRMLIGKARGLAGFVGLSSSIVTPCD